MDEFRLVYFCRETGKEFRVKMITRLDYVILDPETMERKKISRWGLDKDYRASKANKRANPRNTLNFHRDSNDTNRS